MKIEARIFLVVALFCWVAAAVYGFWAHELRTATSSGPASPR